MCDDDNDGPESPPDVSWIEFETRRDIPPAAVFWFPFFALAVIIALIVLMNK